MISNHRFTGLNKMNKINTDDLETMSDHDVDYLYRQIKSKIYRLREMMKKINDASMISDMMFFQVEYCYVKREHNTRIERKKSHEIYMKNLHKNEKRF